MPTTLQTGTPRRLLTVTRLPDTQWVILGRFLLAFVLAGITWVWHSELAILTLYPLLGTVGIILAYNFMLAWYSRGHPRPRRLILATLYLDVMVLTLFFHHSGDIENPLIHLYVVPVVVGAILYSWKSGFALAFWALLLFSLLLAATHLDGFPLQVRHHHIDLLHDYALHSHYEASVLRKPFSSLDWPVPSAHYITTHLAVLAALLIGSALCFGALSARVKDSVRQLEVEYSHLAILLHLLPEGVALLDREGRILLANTAARRLAGLKEGGTFQEASPALSALVDLKTFEGPARELEAVLGGRILSHAFALSKLDELVVWVFRDLTEQRRMLVQLIHQTKMADVGLLAAGIAHEIGNPLASLSGIIQVMLLKRASPEVAERLQAMHTHIDRINRIVQDVTSFSRPSSQQRGPHATDALIEQALKVFRFHPRSKHVQVDIEQPGEPILVQVVEDQIVQVLLNLLLNAADASPPGSRIQIVTEAGPDTARVSVIDHGQGIAPEQRASLFTPFFTTKDPGRGTGLGLFLSDRIVHAHGGSIEVSETPGGGSTFAVILPLTRKEP